MRLNLSLILSIIIAVGLVALIFTAVQISTERNKLNKELELHTRQLINELFKDDSTFFKKINHDNIDRYVTELNEKYNIQNIAIYYNKDSIIKSKIVNYQVIDNSDYIDQAITADSTFGSYIRLSGKNVYQFILPLKIGNISNSALIFYKDAGYIDHILRSIWIRNFIRWFIQALLVSLITLLIIRWGIINPLNKIVAWVKAARKGNLDQLKQEPPAKFLLPLHNEIVHIANAMHEAKAIAEEEAILRAQSESIWTPERLKAEMLKLLDKKNMVVVSNREPYMHIYQGKKIKCIVPASGMITALEPILKACSGLWIASGTGDADKVTVDNDDKIQVPPDNPKYTLKRLWLTVEEETHFYYGFSNEGLWPLCHISHVRPVFREEDWKSYKKVNEDFAKAVILETVNDANPFILIQDYHFALLPELIKKEKPGAKVAIFWHIPWPNPESFGICPWQNEILQGMLGADLIGFHTQYHCNHFLATVNNALESRVSWENHSVNMSGHSTYVKPFPISISFTLKDLDQPNINIKQRNILIKNGLNIEFIGVGVDRIDYTKGIIEKFLAIERFLDKNPSYIGKFTFVQIGAPSRTLLKNYSDLVFEVENEAMRINLRFKSKNWKAILLLKKHHSHEEIAPYYASANFCMVSSLHDGMNLVAKEFVSSRSEEDGVLILSRFAGASQELQGALIINPYDIEKSAEAIKLALEMPDEEQNYRMKQMRQAVLTNNIFSWAANLLKAMDGIHN